MADHRAQEQWILLRQSPRAVGTELRFASAPVCGAECRLLMDKWRDEHNRRLSSEHLKREGKVASALLTPALAAELESFRAAFPSWAPLTPPDGMFPPTSRAAAGVSITSESASREAEDPLGDSDAPRFLPQRAGGCYIRQPALHGNQLVFVCEGDLW